MVLAIALKPDADWAHNLLGLALMDLGEFEQAVDAFEGAIPILSALGALKTEVEERQTLFSIEPAAARRSITWAGSLAGV